MAHDFLGDICFSHFITIFDAVCDEIIKTSLPSRNNGNSSNLLKSAINVGSISDTKKYDTDNYAWGSSDMIKAINLGNIEMVDYIIEKTEIRVIAVIHFSRSSRFVKWRMR